MPAIPLRLAGTARQEPFSRVTPLLRAALVIGPCGGFLFATILTLTAAFHRNTGAWWVALAQAHGHLQLYGWAGLFVLGVALHFLPRLRGAPLAAPRLLRWAVGLQVASIIVRGVGQPLAAATPSRLWSAFLIASGILECLAVGFILVIAGLTFLRGLPLARRPALLKILPLLAIAFVSFGLAALTNLVNMITAASAIGIVPNPGDALNVTLGVLGFFVPVALAMSAQALPMYAGLKTLSHRLLWTLAGTYAVGLLLYVAGLLGVGALSAWPRLLIGLGWLVLGMTLLTCVLMFIVMMRSRGRIPSHMARLSPAPEQMEHAYHTQIATQRANFGPFVPLIASAYLWALIAGLLLCGDGVAYLVTGTELFPFDAIRHSLTVGFLMLLIAGIAPRMLTAFSGGHIATPALVTATLWLGNAATVLRVGAILLALLGGSASPISDLLLGLSGPLGLAVAICLSFNLWPALSGPKAAEHDAI